MFRKSNTFERLLDDATKHKLLQKNKLTTLENALTFKNKAKAELSRSITQEEITSSVQLSQKTPAFKVLKRPEVSIFDIHLEATSKKTGLASWLKEDVLYDLESDVKYEGYIDRHKKEINRLTKHENQKIPKNFMFSSVPGLSKEALEKLSLIKPENLGQASRVSGVTPADMSSLLVFLSK